MRTNTGTWDRVVRILLGTTLLTLTMIGPRTWWGLLGIVPLVTGVSGVCPLYRVFGIDTSDEPGPTQPRYPR
jgi:hypothetical protein